MVQKIRRYAFGQSASSVGVLCLDAHTPSVYLAKSLNFSQSATGLMVALFCVSAVISRPFGGYLMDNYHRFAVLVISLFIMTLIFGSYLLAVTVTSMSMIRLAHGAAFGVCTSSAATVVADILPARKRGEGIGVFGLTISLAMVIGPLIGLKVFTTHGARGMFLSAVAMSLFALICAIWAKVRYKKPMRKKFSLRGLIHTRAMPVSLAMFFVMIVYGSVVIFAGLYALERGFSNVTAFFLCFSVAIMMSRLLLGKLFDRGYILFLIVTGLVLIFAGTVWLGLVRNQTEFLIAGMLAGFGFGTVMPTGLAKVNSLVEQDQRGAANSTYFVSYDLGVGAGALLGGFLSDKMGLGDFYISSSSLILIAAAIFVLKAIPHYHEHKIG